MSATIPAAAQGTPTPSPESRVPFVDREGLLTASGLLFLTKLRAHNLGGNRIIPCHAAMNLTANPNLLTLTPLEAHPLIEGYRDYDAFAFTAPSTSDDPVTATVVPDSGSLATLKVFKANGATQAGSGDIVSGSVYLLLYADHLDSAAGGLVLK